MAELMDFITKEWLTHALIKANLLGEGEIESVNIRGISSMFPGNPKISLVDLEIFEKGESLPLSFAVKVANGVKERIFFSKIAPRMGKDEIIHCYYSEYDDEKICSYLILQNLEKTHIQPVWPIPPKIEQCLLAVNCLASIHVFWWNHSDLEKDLQNMCDLGNTWKARIELAINHLSEFIDFMGDRLPGERRKIYDLVLSSPNQSWLPRSTDCGKTLLHGDAHFWNFMYPIESGNEKIQIIDWNSWDIGRATDDLAYMIGLHWYPSRRLEYENYLLQNYHDQLKNNGIAIKLADLQNEYKKSLIMNLFIPVWQWKKGIHPAKNNARSIVSSLRYKCPLSKVIPK